MLSTSALLIFTLCVINSTGVLGANILVYVVFGGYSHRLAIWPYVEALAENGHNITFVSFYENKDPHPKIHDYAPKTWTEGFNNSEQYQLSYYEIRKNRGMLKMWFDFTKVSIFLCETIYSDQMFLNWLDSSQFDIVVMDTLANECALGLAHHFNAKLVVYSTIKPMAWHNGAHGLPDETSAVPDVMFNFPIDMTFPQRFVNAMNPIIWTLLRKYWYLPKLEEVTKKGLGLEEIPSFEDIEKNASLVLLTSHFALDYPRSLPPNAIAVGGAGLSFTKKPVPKTLLDFIKKGQHGFIYISFGTVTEFTLFDKPVQTAFIKALNKFPQFQFVWKLSDDLEVELPHHIHVTKWAPQQSLLAHPSIKAFITHAGLGSITEAVYYAVPVICLPVLGDQDINAETMAAKGAGIKLEILTLKENELENAINEILENPSYRARMNTLSSVFRDRPTTGLEDAVWWTEFILRHNNTNEFLRPPAVHQPWWIRLKIDVWFAAFGLLLILAVTLVYCMYRIAKIISYLINSMIKTVNKEKNE